MATHPNDLSPSRRKWGKSGKTKVGRLTINCPHCGHTWAVLYRPGENHLELCQRCGDFELELAADGRLEDFEITIGGTNA